jgi:polysaccharide export outer membrane protein
VISQTPLSADRLTVDAAGGLHVPLMGQVDVVGLTLREAEIKVQTELQKLDRFARAGLSVVDSAGHQAIVLGAVAKPGRYPIGPGVRVADLMALAGGPKTEKLDTEEVPQADLAAARVVRSQKALPISVVRALEGVARHNVLVEPGDVLYVPPVKAQHVAVFGEVKNAKMLRFRPGMRLTEAVAGAGGFSASADEADLRLIRGPLSKPKVYLASVKDLTSGKGSDIVLQAGDIVYVTTHWFASITDVLARLTPLLAAGSLAAILATTR